ncbi:MAG: type II methionyl aminopeptidase [Candidatus Bathyarchaeota archaeon]
MLTDEELDKLRKAGKVSAEVRSFVDGIIRENVRIFDVCERIESEILKRGAKPAFPCNVDINEIAAHYTSPPNDDSQIPNGSVVKVDLGAHVDGYIGDTAISICLDPEYLILKQATDDALEAAIHIIKPGVKVSVIGEAIQREIEKYGLKPIRNLTGHGIARFMLHTGNPIPNVASINGLKVEENDVYAIEPFATTAEGEGEIGPGDIGFIYRILKDKPPKKDEERKLLDTLKKNFHTLPFAWRWALKTSPVKNFSSIFENLIKEKFIVGYPTLVELKKQPIAQSEHTVLVTGDGCEVLTA